MKHFLFQTRFWFLLEVLLNICKITSSQTSTLQRPFRGPLSLGHCRKRLIYRPGQGQKHLGSSRSHARCYRPSVEVSSAGMTFFTYNHPQLLLCWGDYEEQQRYEGRPSLTGLVRRQADTPPRLRSLHRAPCGSFQPSVWQTARGGLASPTRLSMWEPPAHTNRRWHPRASRKHLPENSRASADWRSSHQQPR